MRISDWSSDVCSSDLLRSLATPCKIGTRVRIEGHDSGRQPAFKSLFAYAGKNGLMPAMNAIEVAYGHGAGLLAVVTGQGAIYGRRCFHTREFTILCCLTQELLSWTFLLHPPAASDRKSTRLNSSH